MATMAVLVDLSRCTGCRGCQVACKQWNKNPARETSFVGTYENPDDLYWDTFTRVIFKETEVGDKLAWNFRKEQCRHCVEPGCKESCPIEGAIVKHPNGAVVVDQNKCVGGKDGKCDLDCVDGCMYEVPRFMPESPKKMRKCTFCFDRQKAGKKPACVTACLSGTLFYGKREEVIAEGQKRLAELRLEYPDAHLVDAEDVSWIYLYLYEDEKYGMLLDPATGKHKVALG